MRIPSYLLACSSFLLASQGTAQDLALLLYGGENNSVFAGCLNCNQYDTAAICNQYGDFGSRYSGTSIWNPYGNFGSRYQNDSPWNQFGSGLAIVDSDGNYYGQFTLSLNNQTKLPLVLSIFDAYRAMEDLGALRDLLCE